MGERGRDGAKQGAGCLEHGDRAYNFCAMKRSAPAMQELAAEMAAQADSAAGLLKTLGNPQRLRILCALVDGERSVGEINAFVPLSQSALSQHLAVLRAQGLVVTRREAQTIYYALADGPARVILRTLHELYCPPKQPDGRA